LIPFRFIKQSSNFFSSFACPFFKGGRLYWKRPLTFKGIFCEKEKVTGSLRSIFKPKMVDLKFFIKIFIVLALVISCCSNSYARSTIEELGCITQIIVPAYALGMAINENDWEGVRQLTYSFAAMQTSVIGLKCIIDEERPNGSGNDSFPSGHTASAFSGATFIHKRYGFRRAIIPYLLAGFTGYSRIHARQHYFHDVAAGAVISGLFTMLFVDEYNGLQLSLSHESVMIGFKKDYRELQVFLKPESIRLEYKIEF
jgi:membrane-associated phospholipid phosphatase